MRLSSNVLRAIMSEIADGQVQKLDRHNGRIIVSYCDLGGNDQEEVYTERQFIDAVMKELHVTKPTLGIIFDGPEITFDI